MKDPDILLTLILSPGYSEEHYPDFWSYNLAGMITDVKVN